MSSNLIMPKHLFTSRTARSGVWKYFVKGEADASYAVCTLCIESGQGKVGQKGVIANKSGSTTMREHLK